MRKIQLFRMRPPKKARKTSTSVGGYTTSRIGDAMAMILIQSDIGDEGTEDTDNRAKQRIRQTTAGQV